MGPVSMTPLPSATVTTLDRHTRTSSLRRIRHLQELEAKHLGNRSITPDVQIDRSRVLEINTSGRFSGVKISSRVHEARLLRWPRILMIAELTSLYSEFSKYKLEKPHLSDEFPSVSGLLWIHLLAGRGLRATATTTPLSGIEYKKEISLHWLFRTWRRLYDDSQCFRPEYQH